MPVVLLFGRQLQRCHEITVNCNLNVSVLLQGDNKIFDELWVWMSAVGCCSGQWHHTGPGGSFHLCSALQPLETYHLIHCLAPVRLFLLLAVGLKTASSPTSCCACIWLPYFCANQQALDTLHQIPRHPTSMSYSSTSKGMPTPARCVGLAAMVAARLHGEAACEFATCR
jgi:hypothetical protein